MREIVNTFEQFCKKLDKNIIVEERILNDGKRILKCRGCTDCKKQLQEYREIKILQIFKNYAKIVKCG